MGSRSELGLGLGFRIAVRAFMVGFMGDGGWNVNNFHQRWLLVVGGGWWVVGGRWTYQVRRRPMSYPLSKRQVT